MDGPAWSLTFLETVPRETVPRNGWHLSLCSSVFLETGGTFRWHLSLAQIQVMADDELGRFAE